MPNTTTAEERIALLEKQLEDLAGIVGDLCNEVLGSMPAYRWPRLRWEKLIDGDEEPVYLWLLEEPADVDQEAVTVDA